MLGIDKLLEKNPDVQEIFKRNHEKLARLREILPEVEKPAYRLGLPYEDRHIIAGPDDVKLRPKAGYSRL